uniref:G domain-containing protein n=1 Tax=Opuntia streptacantha TaxID=393608 RepID=A0A7C8ZIV9_OPUST
MLVGIPNVGKSALANSLHKIGRISAAEKGKLKHAAVSPIPGETKSINSLKVASHPNIYILDTPGILAPRIIDAEICAKLALTGALVDSLAGGKALAQYFLSVLNLSDEYHKWEKLSTEDIAILEEDVKMAACMSSFDLNTTIKEEFSTDHTKDSVVLNVRRSLFKAISSFRGNLRNEEDMLRLIQAQFRALKQVFNVPVLSEEDADHIVAVKLLNLYRTGRLGHFTLDSLPLPVNS